MGFVCIILKFSSSCIQKPEKGFLMVFIINFLEILLDSGFLLLDWKFPDEVVTGFHQLKLWILTNDSKISSKPRILDYLT